MSLQESGAPAPQPIAPVSQENFPLAIAVGVAAALAGAAIWAGITVASEREFGLVAILIGFLVGFAIQKVGKGTDPKYSMLGAVLAGLGCIVGNALSAVAFYAKYKGYSAGEVMSILDLDMLVRLMSLTFDPMDLLFYGIAVYEGWKFSVVKPVVVSPPAANTP